MTRDQWARRKEQRQADFDTVCRRLIEQGGPSGHMAKQGFRCSYYRQDGIRVERCAFGWLVSEDVARVLAGTTSTGGSQLSVRGLPKDLLPEHVLIDMDFYAALQEAHDYAAMAAPGVRGAGSEDLQRLWRPEWERQMHRLAKRYGLSAKALETEET